MQILRPFEGIIDIHAHADRRATHYHHADGHRYCHAHLHAADAHGGPRLHAPGVVEVDVDRVVVLEADSAEDEEEPPEEDRGDQDEQPDLRFEAESLHLRPPSVLRRGR